MGGGGEAGFSVADYDVLASTYGVVGDGITDNTAAIQATWTAGAGKRVLFDVPGVFQTGTTHLYSGTTVQFVAGVRLNKKLNGVRILTSTNTNGIIVHGNGVELDGSDLPGTTGYSHTVVLLGAKNITLEDVNIIGASSGHDSAHGKDGIYLGYGPGDIACENVTINRGKVHYAKRNGISVTAAFNTVLRGVDIAHTTGSPGSGIDIESNGYDAVDGTLVEDCHLHHNENAGLLSIFGVNSVVRGGSVHDNGVYGVACATGGIQFKDGVYRPNIDVIGITGADNATGVITVGDRSGLPVGMVVNIQTLNGATAPAEISTGYRIVSRHEGSDGVVLGSAVGTNEITSFAIGFTGTMNADPALSDIRFRAQADGQSDGFEVDNVAIYNNGAQGVFLGGSGRHHVHDNRIYDNGGNQIQAQYTRDSRIFNNEIYQTNASSNNNSGISFATGSGTLEIYGNNIHDIRGKGINGSNWTGAEIDGNTVNNCAEYEGSSGKAGINLESIKGFSVTNNRVTQSVNNVTTRFGIRLPSTATNGTITGNDCTGAGTSNADSISVSSGTNIVANNKRRDGTVS